MEGAAGMAQVGYTLKLPSSNESTATVDAVLTDLLTARGVDGLRGHRIAVAVSEAVANAIEHGNRCDPARRVVVSVRLEVDELTVGVRDEGPGFDPAEVPDPRSPQGLLAARGRGLLLMRSFMDEVTCVASLPFGNVVTLRTSLRRQPSPIPFQKEKAGMPAKTRTSGDVTIIDFSGKITIGIGDVELRDAVRGALDAGATKLLINMAGVTTVDSCGIGELVSSYTTSVHRGAKLKLINLTAKVRDLLRITQLITIFDVYDNESEAIESF